MSNFKIAGLAIKTEGLGNAHFNERMKAYRTDTGTEEPDLSVTFTEAKTILVPEGNFVASTPLRTYLKSADDSHFITYDYLYQTDINVATVCAAANYHTVSFRLLDVEPMGGVNLNVRSFNTLGEIFKSCLLFHDGIVLHSSAINYSGNAILFSAPSGTGKSTHTGLWKQFYSDDTTIFNDDSPAIRFLNDIPYAFGTPWSGKTNINENISVPLKAIVFLEQAKENRITKLSKIDAIHKILPQVIRPIFPQLHKLVSQQIDKIISSTPVYLLGCRIDKEAVDLVKNTVL